MRIATLDAVNNDIATCGYRRKHNLITNADVYKVMELYNIDKRTLPAALGIAELTITRWLSGQVPAKKNSDIIKSVLNDCRVFKKLLDKNRGDITPFAYKESSEACERLIALNTAQTKIEACALFMLRAYLDITLPALNNILYITNAFYCWMYDGVFLFDDDCIACSMGASYHAIRIKFAACGAEPIRNCSMNPDFGNMLTYNEMGFLDFIVSSIGIYNNKILTLYMTNSAPWRNAMSNANEHSDIPNLISSNTIRDYYISAFGDVPRTYESIRNYLMQCHEKRFLM